MTPDEYYELHGLILSIIKQKDYCLDRAWDCEESPDSQKFHEYLADSITAAIRDYYGTKTAQETNHRPSRL